ncbi:MAG TPA: tail fiber domain-containing protein, partial [Chthoniobacterales bacterium]|nr:tail fiber domain-containing protein [Chthoniobacterales bacterium]
LKPVTFRYNKEIDPEGIPQFGLVAEDVEKVNAALVTRDADGKVYTVRYEAVNAMLLNEFLKEHRKVQELETARTEEQKEIAELKQQLHEQSEAIRKVSERVELPRPAPQVVDNR